MKTSFTFPSTTAACLVALLAGPRLIKASGSQPGLQYDPETALPCYMWEDNTGDLECEEVREYWDITPEQFSRWNPSVGLDCKPWGLQSYCVVPEVRLEEDPRPMPTEYLEASATADEETASATATDTTTTTTTTTTDDSVSPDPSSWESRGCYVDEDEDSPVLDEAMDYGTFQTIASCKETCFEASFEFAGLKAGVQCFCGSSLAGERADEDECDMPCAGYPLENCGGLDRLSIFRQTRFSDDGDDNANEDANEEEDTNENEDVQDEEGDGEEPTDDNAGDDAGSDDTNGDDTAADDDVVEDEDEVEEAEETTPSGSGAVVETETPESGASRNRIWFF